MEIEWMDRQVLIEQGGGNCNQPDVESLKPLSPGANTLKHVHSMCVQRNRAQMLSIKMINVNTLL